MNVRRRTFLGYSAAWAASAYAPPAVSIAQPSMQSGDNLPAPLPSPIQALKNRRSEAKPITLAERKLRFERARELMTEQKVSAILMTGGTSLSYFTGLRWGNSERMVCFVLPAKGNASHSRFMKGCGDRHTQV
jgi:Xaa-Pro dipeptidase